MFSRSPSPVHRWVVVTVPDTDETFEGVLALQTDDWLVLEQARQLVAEGEDTRRVPVDGRLWLDRLSVPRLQEPDPTPLDRRR